MAEIKADSIIRSHRGSLTLHITPDGKIIVNAPILLPNFLINRFLHEKQEWIHKKLLEVHKRPQATIKQYTEKENFLFLGKHYPLVFTTGTHIMIKEETLYFPKALHFRAKKELENWYIAQAKEIITRRVTVHAEKMKAEYKNLRFSSTKSKWGTCFPDNSLQFNWRLIMAPLLVIDYVVIHELAHTTEKNHSQDFWRKVRLYTPAYRQHREWLNENGHLLMV
jgi:predicted metal-dependent hydrolase